MLYIGLLICAALTTVTGMIAVVVRAIEQLARGISSLPAWNYKFINAQSTEIPRNLQSRVQELEALGFIFLGRYWIELPVKIDILSGVSYVLIDEQRSVLALISVRRVMLIDHIWPVFLTFYDDNFATTSIFRLPYRYFMLFRQVGPLEFTMTRGPAAPAYEKHKERMVEALHDQKRSVVTMNSEQEVLDIIKEHNDAYIVPSLAKRLRITMIFFLCIFALLACVTLSSFSYVFNPAKEIGVRLFDATLLTLIWGTISYIVVRMFMLRRLLFEQH